jgi:hypothetical protein
MATATATEQLPLVTALPAEHLMERIAAALGTLQDVQPKGRS